MGKAKLKKKIYRNNHKSSTYGGVKMISIMTINKDIIFVNERIREYLEIQKSKK